MQYKTAIYHIIIWTGHLNIKIVKIIADCILNDILYKISPQKDRHNKSFSDLSKKPSICIISYVGWLRRSVYSWVVFGWSWSFQHQFISFTDHPRSACTWPMLMKISHMHYMILQSCVFVAETALSSNTEQAAFAMKLYVPFLPSGVVW